MNPETPSTGLERTQDQLEIALREGDEARHLLRLRDRQIETSRRYWLRDAEEALAGDLRALRNRVEMSRMGPVEIVQSAITPASKSADLDAEPSAAAVHRICRLIREGGCKNCPRTEVHHGKECTRGCYLQAAECVNTVETGNPWRKTGDVPAPWVVLPAIAREHSSPRQVLQPIRDEPLLSTGGGESSSRTNSGGTASPKSDSQEGH